jgi:nucleoside-diphosphate-sugar epimerase
MNILVSGSNGFIGSNLVRELAKTSKNNVRSLVLKGTNEDFLDNLDTDIYYGDVLNPDSLSDAMKDIDLIYHLAAIPSDWWNKNIFDINYNGTKNILELAIKNGVQRFVFMSSLVVHGFSNFEAADENTPIVDPKKAGRPYQKSKILCEKLIREKSDEIETVIIRPGFTIFGPNDIMFTYDLCNTLEEGGMYAFLNGGKAKMCYSYVQNLVEGLILAGNYKNAANEIFILCDDKPEYTTLREFTDLVCKELDIEVPTTSLTYWIAYPFVSLYENIARLFGKKKAPRLTVYRLKVAKHDLYFKCEKAKTILSYEPKISLEDGIKKSIQWYRDFKDKIQ